LKILDTTTDIDAVDNTLRIGFIHTYIFNQILVLFAAKVKK